MLLKLLLKRSNSNLKCLNAARGRSAGAPERRLYSQTIYVADKIALIPGVTKYECQQTRTGACVIFTRALLVFCFRSNLPL